VPVVEAQVVEVQPVIVCCMSVKKLQVLLPHYR